MRFARFLDGWKNRTCEGILTLCLLSQGVCPLVGLVQLTLCSNECSSSFEEVLIVSTGLLVSLSFDIRLG